MLKAPLSASDVARIQRLLVWQNLIALAITCVAAGLQLGVWAAYLCVGVSSLIYLSQLRLHRACPLFNLMLFGLVAGVLVLAVDWWLVEHLETLRYVRTGPQVLASPLYMPLGWAGLTLSIGFLGWVVARKYGMLAGALGAAVLSATLVPAYEILAPYAGWWSYVEQPRIFGVIPWKIVVAEFHVGLALPALVAWVLARRNLRTTLIGGVLAGLWLCACASILVILP